MGTFQGNMPDPDRIGALCGRGRSTPDRIRQSNAHSSPRAFSTTLFTAHSAMPMATSTPARM